MIGQLFRTSRIFVILSKGTCHMSVPSPSTFTKIVSLESKNRLPCCVTYTDKRKLFLG